MSPDDVQFWMMVGTLTGAVGTVGAVLVAWLTLGGAKRQLEEEGRPYVSVQLAPSLWGSGNWDVVVVNHGKTTARHVVIEVTDPANLEPQNEDDKITAALLRTLRTPVDLVPGERLRYAWRFDHGDSNIHMGVAVNTDIHLVYANDKGQRFHGFRVLRSDLGEVIPAPAEGPTSSDRDVLKNINHALRTLNQHIGELRR